MNGKSQITALIFWTLGTFIIFTACRKDNVDYGLDEYRVDLATVKQVDDNPVFILDDGINLISENNISDISLNEGQRVRLNYSYLPDVVENSTTYIVRINGLSTVPLGNLQAMRQAEIDSLPNDPIEFESVWTGSHYLNVTFRLEYYSTLHKIFLVTDSTKLENDRIYLFFRHDNNNDTPGYESNAIISYDLSQLLGEPQSNKTLLVNFHTINYGDTVFTVRY